MRRITHRVRHRIRQHAAAGAAAGLAAALLAAPAAADEWANPDSDGGIEYGIHVPPDNSTEQTDPGDDSGDDYSDDYTPTDLDSSPKQLSPADITEGGVYGGLCTGTFGNGPWCTTPDPVIPQQESAPEEEQPPPNPADLGRTLVDRIALPSPKVSIAPGPPNPTLVNLWTWFWIPESQWQERSESMTVGPTTVTVTIAPERVVWETGEGTTVCDGPGDPWTPGSDAETSSCGHSYEDTTVDEDGGKHTVSASIKWRASWSCTGVCIGNDGDLGVLSSDSVSTRLEVRQRQSLVID